MEFMNLGDRITVTERLYRRSKEVPGINTVGKYIPSHTEKYWVSDKLRKPREVMIIGKRTLRNGIVTYHRDIGSVFESRSVIHAYLVVKDMNSKPFYIKMP